MSKIGTKILLFMNRFFKLPVHPFNLNNDGVMTYSEWQFEKAEDTIAYYTKHYTKDEIFRDKEVLDCGCGEAGKTIYYATLGVKKVTGIDIFPDYEARAIAFAEKKGVGNRFAFCTGSASDLPFPDNSFDSIIMNDFIEHVSDPSGALREALRVLRPGGRIYSNFPPYYHPYGAHLSDAIGIPWVHLFFRDPSMIGAYKRLVSGLPDGEDRIRFRFSTDSKGKEYISYINKMTIRRFESIINDLGVTPILYEHTPLRSFFALPAKLPLLREVFTKMVTFVIEKP